MPSYNVYDQASSSFHTEVFMNRSICFVAAFVTLTMASQAVHYNVYKNRGPKCKEADCSHKGYAVVEEKSTTHVLAHNERSLRCTGCGTQDCKFTDLPKGIASIYLDVHMEEIDQQIAHGRFSGNLVSFLGNERIITSWSARETEDEPEVTMTTFTE
jgi:hypothetical protein